MAENANAKIKQAILAAAGAGDIETLRKLCHPEMINRQNLAHPFGGVRQGPEQFLETVGVIFGTYKIDDIQLVRSFTGDDDPDHMVFHFHLKGHTVDGHRMIDTPVLEEWHFENGQAREITVCWLNVP